MKNTLISILIFASAFCTLLCEAAERNDSVVFRFRQGRHELDSTYAHNREAMHRVRALMDSAESQVNRISRIRIIGTASPEGSVDLNRRLSDRRANELLRRLNISLPDSAITLGFTGRDWQGLQTLAENDQTLPDRQEVLQMLQTINLTDSLQGGEKEDFHNLRRLQSINGGKPYAYMYRRLFPGLRTSQLYIEYGMPAITDNLIIPGLETAAGPMPIPEQLIPVAFTAAKAQRNFYMSVKTNLLYDALALPTIGAEFYLGKNFSIAGEWTYGWWDTDRKHRYWRAYGGDLSFRWWFGKAAQAKPLTGHHIGIYGGVITYDFEFGGEGQMGGLPGKTLWDRCQRMAGIEYGYSLPIASRLNLDFTIGIGYLGGKYIKYYPSDRGYVWQSTHRRNWFGPTKAEISLVWLLGHGNRNIKKGGER